MCCAKTLRDERVKLKEAVSIGSRIAGAGDIIISSLDGASDDELVKSGYEGLLNLLYETFDYHRLVYSDVLDKPATC
jgi:hypothetical protein